AAGGGAAARLPVRRGTVPDRAGRAARDRGGGGGGGDVQARHLRPRLMRRLGAIGTFVWDRIDNPFVGRPGVREQWGGAVYSFASLSATCPEGWVVEPIVKVGADF